MTETVKTSQCHEETCAKTSWANFSFALPIVSQQSIELLRLLLCKVSDEVKL